MQTAYSTALEIVNGNVMDHAQIIAAINFVKAEKKEAENTLSRSPLTSAIRQSEMCDKALMMLYRHFNKYSSEIRKTFVR